MNKRHRTFIAINLPAEVRRFLADFKKKWPELSEIQSDGEFSADSSVAKWTDIENLHITFIFLGDLTDLELGEVCMAVKNISEKYDSFDIHLNKVGYGPADKIPPRYIWAGGEINQEAFALKKELEEALLELVHFVPDKGVFSPHITLARISSFLWRAINPEERPNVDQDIDLAFTVESIEVMESELKKGGPQYNVIESYPLK